MAGVVKVFALESGLEQHSTTGLYQTSVLDQAFWADPDTLQAAQLAWLKAADRQPPSSAIIISTSIMWGFL